MAKKIASVLLILFISVTPFIGSAQLSSSPNLTPIWGTPIALDPIWGLSEQQLGNRIGFIDPIWEPTVLKRNQNRDASNNRYNRANQNDYNNSNINQQQSPIWNRQTAPQGTEMSRRESENQASSLRRRLNEALRTRDTLGRLMLADSLAIAYADSTKENGSAAGSLNNDFDQIAPPPDDPEDAPIDGGLSILIAIGLVHGYKLSQKKVAKTQTVEHGL